MAIARAIEDLVEAARYTGEARELVLTWAQRFIAFSEGSDFAAWLGLVRESRNPAPAGRTPCCQALKAGAVRSYTLGVITSAAAILRTRPLDCSGVG
jgi:hypothetical protein